MGFSFFRARLLSHPIYYEISELLILSLLHEKPLDTHDLENVTVKTNASNKTIPEKQSNLPVILGKQKAHAHICAPTHALLSFDC